MEDAKSYNLLIVDFDTPLESGLEFVKQIRSNPLISSELKIIMMVPLMREDIFPKIEEARIDFGITKPIIPSILYNGILEIFKAKTLEPEKKIALTQTSDYMQIKNSYHMLVVEDNKTNQFIVKEILEQAGFQRKITLPMKLKLKMSLQN